MLSARVVEQLLRRARRDTEGIRREMAVFARGGELLPERVEERIRCIERTVCRSGGKRPEHTGVIGESRESNATLAADYGRCSRGGGEHQRSDEEAVEAIWYLALNIFLQEFAPLRNGCE